MAMRGTVALQSTKQLGTGNGYVQIGKSVIELLDVGSLEGAVTEVATREVLQAFDGNPQLPVYEEVIREMARISFVMKEKNLKILARTMGYDPDTEIDDTRKTQSATNILVGTAGVAPFNFPEKKILYQQNWAHLYGTNIDMTVGNEPSVQYVPPTGAKVDLDDGIDYIIDGPSGAIRRIATSTKLPDGGMVEVAYGYKRGSTMGIHIGGKQFRTPSVVRFVYPRAWGGREIFEYGLAYPSGETQQAFAIGAWHTREVSFTAMADMTQAEGNRLRQNWIEEAWVTP